MPPSRPPAALALAAVAILASCGSGPAPGLADPAVAGTPSVTTTPSTTVPPAVAVAVVATPPAPVPTTRTTTTLVPPDGRTAAQRSMRLVHEVTGQLSPKSVVWTGGDLFLAQNMVYLHTIAVYDRAYQRVALISDAIRLSDFGYPEHEGVFSGGPVEAAVDPSGRYAYVSNYQTDGPGFENPGNDECDAGPWDPSFVYRVDLAQLRIDQVIAVGAVPKYVAVTPDGRYVLVTNWCSYDMSVVDVALGREVRRVPLGRFPRGIVVAADGRTATVALMGESSLAVVDLGTFTVERVRGVGAAPRHLVLSPDGATIYVSLNGEGSVVTFDVAARRVVGRVETGDGPRSMVISDDGTALYVANYLSATVSKVRTSDLAVLETVETAALPIGITYDAATRHVWVANYSGSLQVFADE